jgi:hypothetical protein
MLFGLMQIRVRVGIGPVYEPLAEIRCDRFRLGQQTVELPSYFRLEVLVRTEGARQVSLQQILPSWQCTYLSGCYRLMVLVNSR